MSRWRGMNGSDKQDSIIALLIFHARISYRAPTLQVVYATLRSADPGVPFAVPHVVRMHGKALFFQPVAHGNDLRLPRVPRGPVRMDVSRKNERHIVTLLPHALADELGHGFVAIHDFRIKKEERYLLRLRELESIANQIQHGLAGPAVVKVLN